MWKYDNHTIVIKPNGLTIAYADFHASFEACGAGCESMLGSTYRLSIERGYGRGRTLEQVIEPERCSFEEFKLLPVTMRVQ